MKIFTTEQIYAYYIKRPKNRAGCDIGSDCRVCFVEAIGWHLHYEMPSIHQFLVSFLLVLIIPK